MLIEESSLSEKIRTTQICHDDLVRCVTLHQCDIMQPLFLDDVEYLEILNVGDALR